MFPSVGGVSGNTTKDVNPRQAPKKAMLPICVTEFPIVNVPENPAQPENAFVPMLFTELGIVREPVKPLQPLKAFSPMYVTEFPRFKAVKPIQSLKA